jgi:predicted transcriptional regulator
LADKKDGGEDTRNLPPIHRIKEPAMKHMSTRIRWYHKLGYTVGEIHNGLGVRYQQVRNVVTTEPKRAAREDLPPLKIELLELDDDHEAMDKHHLEAEMRAQRAEHLSDRRATNRARRKAREDQTGNEDLDNEDYGREDEE